MTSAWSNLSSQHVHVAVGICWKRLQWRQEGKTEKEIETEAEKEAHVDAQAEEDWATILFIFIWSLRVDACILGVTK